MPSSSAPRRSDAYSNASASQKLGSYVCHEPIVPFDAHGRQPASIYELLDDARRRRRPGLLLGDWAGSAFVKKVGETWLCANHVAMAAPTIGII